MKPKIFIAIHYMEIGGAERALLGFLNALDTNRVDIYLFVYWHTGEFMKLIPSKIHLLDEIPAYSMVEKPIKEVMKTGFFKVGIARLCGKFLTYCYKLLHPSNNETLTDSFIGRCVSHVLPDIPGEYDLAISFLTPHNYVMDHVKARKKIAWIHTDYRNMHVNRTLDLKTWGGYDYIASISADVTDSFLSVFPELRDKIILVKNILSPRFVREQADMQDVSKEMPKEDGVIRILSVGRYSPPKNFDNVPSICTRVNAILSSQNVPTMKRVKWYIIGYGPDEPLIRQMIKEERVEDNVILLGKKANPYPYMKECDIYVQPSRYEGNCVAVREAQILCKPVVITNYSTAPSQIKAGEDGVIVPLDNQKCAEGIVKLILDHDLQERIINVVSSIDYGNEDDVNVIYELLGIENSRNKNELS